MTTTSDALEYFPARRKQTANTIRFAVVYPLRLFLLLSCFTLAGCLELAFLADDDDDDDDGTPPPVTFTLTYTAGAGGSINGVSPQTVEEGADGSPVTAEPDPGFSFVEWSDSSTDNPRTDSNVMADISVTAQFLLDLVAPTNVQAEPGDKQVTVSWDDVPEATGHDLCYAEETITDFDNCASFTGGMLKMNVTSPHTVPGLTNGTEYFFRVIATRDAEEGPPSAEVSATPGFAPVGGLNDTGIDWCANDSTNFDVGTPLDKANTCMTVAATHPGQDGMLGRDAVARQDEIDGTNTLNKTGAGAAGFDFTKVCNSGEIAGEGACPANPALGPDPDDWACTRDNVTGLIWEVKVDDATDTLLRDRSHSYTWFNDDPATNGGDNGTADGGTCMGSNCDTQAFVEAVNSATLCGESDWRLPAAGELLSIAHRGVASPAIDTAFFPNTSSNFYWSSSPDAGNADFAWNVNFNFGNVNALLKSLDFRVRLVRAGPPVPAGDTTCAGTENPAITATTPTVDFMDNGDGTVTHTPTGLMWKRCSQGQTWTAGTATCDGSASTHNWADALAEADGDSFAGHSDWRLPNANELESIVERRCEGPAINAAIFPGTPGVFYWSSSPFANDADDAWGVGFGSGALGGVNANNKLNVDRVRLVRAGQ